MNLKRALATLVAAAIAGFLLWLSAQFDTATSGGYWAALGIIAGGGLVVGAVRLRAAGGNPSATLALAFLPVLVCAGWVLIYAEPHANWFRTHVTAWSGDIAIRGVVHDVAIWNGVLAFGIGLMLAYALEPSGLLRRGRTVELSRVEDAHDHSVVAADRDGEGEDGARSIPTVRRTV